MVKKEAKPVTWPEDFSVPPLIAEFHQLLAKIQADPSPFLACHLYLGKSLNGTNPVIKVQNKMVGLAQLSAPLLGLTIKRGLPTCGNGNCVNPFHRLIGETPLGAVIATVTATPLIGESHTPMVEDYIELVEYTREKNRDCAADFDVLRPLIDKFDLDDAQLKWAIEEINKRKESQ